MTLTNFEKSLNKYADLTVSVGANIMSDDIVHLKIAVDQAEFARLIVKKSYEHGAKNVIVDWFDDPITRLKIENSTIEELKNIAPHEEQKVAELLQLKVKRIVVFSSDPDSFSGVNHDHLLAYQKTQNKLSQSIRKASQNNDLSWTIVAAPSLGWAKKVFPKLSDEDAVDSLWNQIFKINRIYTDNPIAAWKEHEKNLVTKAKLLTKMQFKAIHYTSPTTNLIIGLPKNHIWRAGGSLNPKNESFMPNMPTEEVFTSPDKNKVNGTVTSTKPLSLNGQLIKELTLTFTDGKITKIKANPGQEILENLISTDTGSAFLGEVSLVPNSSPISKSNLIFFNTLFDENASNHLAIGASYPFTIKDGTKMSPLELQNNGLNVSNVHVDFMIGSSEMDIDGIDQNNQLTPIFRKGEWVI